MNVRSLVEWLRNPGRTSRIRNALARRQRYRADLESLEDRLAPAVINWDGGGDNVNWCDARNWEGDRLPVRNETARISQPFSQPTKMITCDVWGTSGIETAASLTIAGGALLQFAGGGYVNGVGNPLPTLLNQGTMIVYYGTGSVGMLFENAGSLSVGNGCDGHSLFLADRGLTNTPTGSISLNGGCSYSTRLQVFNGFLNNLRNGDQQGMITVYGGGSRTIDAELNNQGTIQANGDVYISRGSAQHSNSGRLIAWTGAFFIDQSGPAAQFVNDPTGSVEAHGRSIYFRNDGAGPRVTTDNCARN